MAGEASDSPTPSASEKVLADEILAEADGKAERARQRGEREARQIVARARQQALEAADQVLATARERGERIAASILASVEAEAQRDLLAAREAELDRLFDAARQRLADKGSYNYPAVLATLAAQAIEAMAADEVIIELCEQDRALATDAWLDEVRRRVGRPVTIDVSASHAPIDGGLIVRSADGRLLYDNSFRARLERLKPELRRQLAARLFTADAERGTSDAKRDE